MGSGYPAPGSRRDQVLFDQGLDESTNGDRSPGTRVAINVVYRPFGTMTKRPGTSISSQVGLGAVGGIRSGYRWYRGSPTILKQTVVQVGDKFYWLNDGTGVYTLLDNGAAGTSPAYYCSFFDAAESGVAGTPASDILIYTVAGFQPRKWDGTNLTILSPSIPNPFTGCETWNGHVWFWGDPAFPTTLFATDIFNPEGFVFMNTPGQGGYQIGRGDGDPLVQRAMGVGPYLVILKSGSIYMAQGFDFTGEAQFTFQPMVRDAGTSNGHTAALLRGQVYFFSGSQFMRYLPGNTEAEPIGIPLLNSMAKLALSSQAIMRGIAGDFIVTTLGASPVLYTNVYMCCADYNADGQPDSVLMFDLDASEKAGRPMWTILEGVVVGAFVPYTAKQGDTPLLYMGDYTNPTMRLFGGNATADSILAAGDTPISARVQVGRYDFGTPDQIKRLDRVFFRMHSNAATFTVEVSTDVDDQSQQANPIGQLGGTAIVGTAIVGTAVIGNFDGTAYQAPPIDFKQNVKGLNFLFDISESSITSAWSLESLGLHINEESVIR